MESHHIFSTFNEEEVKKAWARSVGMASPARRVKWTAIVLTCANKTHTQALQKELEIRQAKGYIDRDVILLTVEDPKSNVGSGGATINALLTVVEFISARKGYTVINPDVLEDAKILILHHGRPYGYDTCGRVFMTLPVHHASPQYDGLVDTIDTYLKIFTEKLAVKADPGVWIGSTDMLLSIPIDAEIPWEQSEAIAITVPSTPQYCKDHGVFKIDTQGFVEDILYKEKVGNLESCQRSDGSVPSVVGIVYFNEAVAGKLLSFYMKPPLDACTYMGLDSGQPPLQLSLYFDVLLPMTTGLSETDFVSGERSGTFGKPMQQESSESRTNMALARSLLWKELHGYRMRTCMVEGGSFLYLTDLASEHKKMMLACPLERCGFKDLIWSNIIHSCMEGEGQVDDKVTIINSRLQGEVTVAARSVVSHCDLHGRINIGRDSVITCLNVEEVSKKKRTINFGEGLVIQGYHIYLKTLRTSPYVLTVHGRFDNIKAPSWKSTSSFCNEPWLVVLNRTGITKEDLWGTELENDNQTILTAKMFPVFHATDVIGLREILWLQGQLADDGERTILKRWRTSWRLSLEEIQTFTDAGKIFEQRRELFYNISNHEICNVLTKQQHKGFRNVYNSASVEGYSQTILKSLDEVASSTRSPGIAARTLANIADVLGCMAGNKGGLRSGPAANKSWSKAFGYLEAKDLAVGVAALAKERERWLGRPDLLVRAARHYEGAAQILIRQAVMTAKEFFNPQQGTLPRINKWVTAECPARIDISGGWSDTPPITYEHGGAVTIVGLLINGKRPIGVKARRIPEPVIKLEICSDTAESQYVECKELSDLEDYYQPHTPGALLKASFVCADIVDLMSSKSLAKQLLDNYGGGFEMQSWSNMPTGSGLGTSSILAGAVMGAVLTAGGKTCDPEGLVHAVLYLEQLLTTGGGWQDQIGGLFGGVRLGVSEAQLPLKVEAIDLQVSERYVQKFSDRLVLIYTGKTRLARNLLQDVIRNWYARNPHIVTTEDALVMLARECGRAFTDGDLEALGSCANKYWEMKKRMAPGCETLVIQRIMEVLRPHSLGLCMAGAGGGGFMWGIMKEPSSKDKVEKLLATVEGLEDAVVYEACVDQSGLSISIEE
ncbi:L-fucose kinase-like isoform X2 [Haliotis rufescens]|uniref:L-fucose kinase-like isoform X2 n=1 Tax=Haliotis rufescens TaxID=6454 RepID=UPI00201FB1C3|nr:L-fucose kinase-like isoform X2 [Haliotis rufescens]